MLPRLFTLVCLAVCLESTSAYAEPVLFLHAEPRAMELYEALELELRGFGSVVALRPAPAGMTEATRTAAALAAARQVSAVASVWVERDPPLRVRVVHAGNEQIVEAPLPAQLAEIEARTFGAIAGSAVLEGLGQRADALKAAPVEEERGESAALHHLEGHAAPVLAPRSMRQPTMQRMRPFARLGGVLGIALARHDHTPDRTPAASINDIDSAARPGGALDTELASSELRKRGFDCDVRNFENQLIVSDCHVALNPAGAIYLSAVELQAGVQWSSYEFAMTTRFSPSAGHGALAHWLLGAQVGRLLTTPSDRGFWAQVLLGLGMGQIQARPPSSERPTGPFIRSGLFEAHVGGLLGYRFVPEFGLYGGVVGRGFMPDPLFVFDLSAGLEARL